MNKLRLMGASASIILAASGAIAKQNHMAKHLAGPAEEIELMQKASPDTTAIISKHAMIAVDMTQNKSGQYQWQKNILIDGEIQKLCCYLQTKTTGNW